MGGKLILVGTPIGNLADLSPRVCHALKTADIVLAEDTRRALRLFKACRITKQKVVSYYQENEEKRIPQVLHWLRQGKTIVLTTNAGMPLISDPGYKLVKRVLAQGYFLEVVPGPSPLLTALLLSGFPPDRFAFLGFLPKRVGRKRKLLASLVAVSAKYLPVFIFYESPRRLGKTIKLLSEIFGPKLKVAICRELTKKHEEVLWGTSKELEDNADIWRLKGEITVVCWRQDE